MSLESPRQPYRIELVFCASVRISCQRWATEEGLRHLLILRRYKVVAIPFFPRPHFIPPLPHIFGRDTDVRLKRGYHVGRGA